MTVQAPSPIYSFSAERLDGTPVSLEQFRGKVLLIVNTASQCGFTPQYQGLQALYDQYASPGLEVLGFPCNQFGAQEPGGAEQIQSFCETRFGVTFPLFAKVDVNGDQAHPLFKYLTQAQPGIFGLEAIKWNFTKFLVDRQGQVVKRYGSITKPEEIAGDIKALL
jgi:glutathione peroxidase